MKNLKSILRASLVAVAIPSFAFAQAGDPQPDPPPPVVDPPPDPTPPDPDPVFQPDPPPANDPPPDPPPMPADDSPKASNGEGAANRPSGFSVGFGFGYDLPADLQVPDTTSVRFRLPGGLIIEPAIDLSRTSDHDEVGMMDTTDNTGVFALAGSARFPLIRSNSMDFVGVGGAGLSLTVIDPEGGNNDTTITALSLFYGIGIDLWIRKHWALSFTTTNPLITFLRSSTDGVGGDTVASDTTFGVIFDPDVLLMLHLFFD